MNAIVNFAVGRLAQFVRSEVSDAVSKAVIDGVADGFAQAGINIDEAARTEMLRTIFRPPAPVNDGPPTFPSVKPTQLINPPPKKRGRPPKAAPAAEGDDQ